MYKNDDVERGRLTNHDVEHGRLTNHDVEHGRLTNQDKGIIHSHLYIVLIGSAEYR